jgi:CBS domain containing-hemolysin-like protein
MRVIRDSGHSRFPLSNTDNNDEIVGLVLAKDLFAAMLAGENEPWRDLLRYRREPLIVPENQKISELFELMRVKRAHMAMVVDEYGDQVGIVTLEDLLEEIVGEILDETDSTEAASVRLIDNNHWVADGLTSLADIERSIGLKVPDELDANTISGLCMQRLGRMPQAEDVIVEQGFRITIMATEDRRVGHVHIEKILGRPDEDAENSFKTDITTPQH